MEASQGAVADLLGVEGTTMGMEASGVAAVEASAMIRTSRQRVATGARSHDLACMPPLESTLGRHLQCYIDGLKHNMGVLKMAIYPTELHFTSSKSSMFHDVLEGSDRRKVRIMMVQEQLQGDRRL